MRSCPISVRRTEKASAVRKLSSSAHYVDMEEKDGQKAYAEAAALAEHVRAISVYAQTLTEDDVSYVHIPENTLERKGFHRSGSTFIRHDNGFDVTVTDDDLSQYVRIEASNELHRATRMIRRDGSTTDTFKSISIEAFRDGRDHVVTWDEGPVQYFFREGVGEESRLLGRYKALQRYSGDDQVFEVSFGDKTRHLVTQGEIDAMAPNAFQTSYQLEEKLADVLAVFGE